MEFEFFIGIDVSKNELDFAIQQGDRFLLHREIANEPSAIGSFIKELNKLPGFKLDKALFCMEHTGIYNNHSLACLQKKKAHICLEAATQIKNSLGNIRGKNDKIDAKRIAGYAYDKRNKLSLWVPKREVVQQLAHLSATRLRLITIKKQLKVPLNEHAVFNSGKIARQSLQICSHSLKAIDEDIKRADKAIEQIIQGDTELSRLFSLVTSVVGIGKVTALQTIITTNEFKDINNPKSFACYCGVAPFKEDSGKVVKKARVSHMANKKVKTLLHLSAIVAIQYNADLKRFYERKVLEEKKNKMSVINAVRNKLILRIFACVNQNRPYEKNYHKLIA
ncbi:IS110 family transposase [Mucilaginibacter jinjuensis]|uniref:IS110 family transposase n=1 Tax=Mucilaginibacter jinjuensis TaxID=1176721 RepID=A0ABY7TBU6_9SPHI|nr:IS110 family transposase [Mucilaginibacter jinjuensis]WCT12368.1 IS110 family transposase [Mucilaginibacter jinjuensis]WCT12599.1 IS110 family transposase [Mucilaginibacter jinjuensis]WCT13540.1 IS110 family transposase [Mucilaginibacter jinjuensis]